MVGPQPYHRRCGHLTPMLHSCGSNGVVAVRLSRINCVARHGEYVGWAKSTESIQPDEQDEYSQHQQGPLVREKGYRFLLRRVGAETIAAPTAWCAYAPAARGSKQKSSDERSPPKNVAVPVPGGSTFLLDPLSYPSKYLISLARHAGHGRLVSRSGPLVGTWVSS